MGQEPRKLWGLLATPLNVFPVPPKTYIIPSLPIVKSEKSKKVTVSLSALTRPLISYINATHSPSMHAPLSSQSSHHTHRYNTHSASLQPSLTTLTKHSTQTLKPDAHKPTPLMFTTHTLI